MASSLAIVFGLLAFEPTLSWALASEDLPPFTARVYAVRQGMVGATTASGHVIQERDRFVALPARDVVSRGERQFQVRLSYRGRVAVAPVLDVGPYNTTDDYWAAQRRGAPELPRYLPQAEAAFRLGHNGGFSLDGRRIAAPVGIDLGDGTFWDDLGMTGSDWIEVTFLWLTE